jgi:hypothetical protein
LNNFVRLLTKAWPIFSIFSNRPIITYLGCQWNPKNLMTRTNISCAPLDIHKLKLIVTYIQSINFGKTYISFVFSTKLCDIS